MPNLGEFAFCVALCALTAVRFVEFCGAVLVQSGIEL